MFQEKVQGYKTLDLSGFKAHATLGESIEIQESDPLYHPEGIGLVFNPG
jgi:hypothetical protein